MRSASRPGGMSCDVARRTHRGVVRVSRPESRRGNPSRRPPCRCACSSVRSPSPWPRRRWPRHWAPVRAPRSAWPPTAARRAPGPRPTRPASARRAPVAATCGSRSRTGRVSEVFYPDLSTPSARSLELVVTDGATFTDRESEDVDVVSRVPTRAASASPQVGTDDLRPLPDHQAYVTDPRRDALVVRVRLESLDGGSTGCTRPRPGAGQLRLDDRAARPAGDAGGHGRKEPSRPRSSRARASAATSTGLLGRDDGWTDLEDDQRLDEGGVRPARATSCRPDGSRA